MKHQLGGLYRKSGEDGNLVWGGEVKIPLNKFHVLALSVASLQKWMGRWACPEGYRNQMRC